MRNRFGWVLALVGGSLLIPGAAEAQNQVAAGAQVYAQNCSRCHTARSPLERTDREWVTIVAHMRARGNLTKTQAADVLSFLQAANGTEAPASTPTSPSDVNGAAAEDVDRSGDSGGLDPAAEAEADLAKRLADYVRALKRRVERVP